MINKIATTISIVVIVISLISFIEIHKSLTKAKEEEIVALKLYIIEINQKNALYEAAIEQLKENGCLESQMRDGGKKDQHL